ncbi:tRNA synthetases class I (M)-domain-containing protein, partial [Gorgonomyces haynaldii]
MKLVSTPIFYVNSQPHLGHLYTAVLGDVCARYERMRGCKILFSTGTDEHGLKIQQSAQGDIKKFCDRNSHQFQALFDRASVKYDRFIRTTDKQHIANVQDFYMRIKKHVFLGLHEGWYSVSDETFVPHNLTTKSGNKTISSETGKELEWHSEENYKISLSKFQPQLKEWMTNAKILPQSQKEFVNRQLDHPLHDLSISRPRTRLQWGVPVPDDPKHLIYVWVDALVNYLTVSDYPHWNPLVHFVGKDIVKFHCIYWPVLLLAADLELPNTIVSHGHWLVNNKKMSKSDFTGVDPHQLINDFGVDTLRYYLIRDGGYKHDPVFSVDGIKKRLQNDLAGQFGNLYMRCTSKKMNPFKCIPVFTEYTPEQQQLEDNANALQSKINHLLDQHDYQHICESVMDCIYQLNHYWGKVEPWKLSIDDRLPILHLTLETIRVCAILLQPVMPEKMVQVLDAMNITKRDLKDCVMLRYTQEHKIQSSLLFDLQAV